MSEGVKRTDITRELLEDMYWDRGMSQRQIAKELGCSQSAIRRGMREFGIEVRPSNKDKYSFTPSYGADMAYVVGVYIGDGGISGRDSTFSLQVKDKDFCEYTKKKLERVAEGVSEIGRNSKDGYYVNCYNTDFASWLVFITDGKETIPEFCRESKENIMAFLEGIMDSEGSISKGKQSYGNAYKYQCAIGMDSELMNDIVEMFEAVGVRTNRMSLTSSNCYNLPLNLYSLVNSGFKFHIARKQEVLDEYKELAPKRSKWNKELHFDVDDDQILF